MTDNLTF